MKIEKEVTRYDLVFASLQAAQEFYSSMATDLTITRNSERDIEITNTDPAELNIHHCNIIARLLDALPNISWYFTIKDGKPMIRIF